MCHAMRRQIPEELRAVRREIPRAECTDGTTRRHGHGKIGQRGQARHRMYKNDTILVGTSFALAWRWVLMQLA